VILGRLGKKISKTFKTEIHSFSSRLSFLCNRSDCPADLTPDLKPGLTGEFTEHLNGYKIAEGEVLSLTYFSIDIF